MKEKLYTIPLNDAFNEHDECPFCFIERKLEQDMLDFLLGNCSSYMESDIRSTTDQEGFCQLHFQKMYDYSNTLGNGWILKTHYETMIKEMKQQFQSFDSKKLSLFSKKSNAPSQNSLVNWIQEKEESCYVCKRSKEIFERYLDTFFVLFKTESEFHTKIKESKGFCLSHLKKLCIMADIQLKEDQKKEFYEIVFKLMEENMVRVSEDVSWLVEKFDYRNHDADWKDSKDAVQRGMQKLKGGYPADAPYKMNK
ncbi:MAG: DUF6062 family protein [Eubacteriales bacterium]